MMLTKVYRKWSLWCAGCHKVVLNYQKRGSGVSQLIKVLPERVVEEAMRAKVDEVCTEFLRTTSSESAKNFECQHCGSSLAKPFLLDPRKGRVALGLFRDKVFVKKTGKRVT